MPSRYLNPIAISVALFVAYLPVAAGPLVEKGAKLELISNEFQLADGPSWNGSRLLIPDVKGETIYQYDPKSDRMDTLVPGAGRISASYYNNGRLYLSENAHGRISWLSRKQIDSIAGQDLGVIPGRPTTSSPTTWAASTIPSQDPDRSSISILTEINALP